MHHIIALIGSLVVALTVAKAATLSARGLSRPRRQLNVDIYRYDGDNGFNAGGSQLSNFPQQQQGFQFQPEAFQSQQQRFESQPFQPQIFQEQPPPANELVFSNNVPTGPRTVSRQSAVDSNAINAPTATTPSPQVVFINNRPTLATMAPFRAMTTPSAQFLRCFDNCPTTSEYNPVCGSNMERYYNEQKFQCARRCGADVEIVRRGSCEGLFPMLRG